MKTDNVETKNVVHFFLISCFFFLLVLLNIRNYKLHALLDILLEGYPYLIGFFNPVVFYEYYQYYQSCAL